MSSCNENHLDPRCACSSKFGEGSLSRIYDIPTGEFVCCGNIQYDMYNAFQDESSLIKAAAALDDPRCHTWWTRSIDRRETLAPLNAGPTPSKLSILRNQNDISYHFPNPDIIGPTGTVSCVGITSPGVPSVHTTVPRYVSYLNPDAGEKYIETIQCVPRGTDVNPYRALRQTGFAKTGDFAIFGIEGCTDAPLNSVCVPSKGIENLGIGPLEFESTNYNGPIHPGPTPEPCEEKQSSRTWLIIVLVVLAVIFIILVICMFMASGKSGATAPPPPPPPPPPGSGPNPYAGLAFSNPSNMPTGVNTPIVMGSNVTTPPPISDQAVNNVLLGAI